MAERDPSDSIACLIAAVSQLKTLAYGIELSAQQTDCQHMEGCAHIIEDIQNRVYAATIELDAFMRDGNGESVGIQ